jgi:hypothetical protein
MKALAILALMPVFILILAVLYLCVGINYLAGDE